MFTNQPLEVSGKAGNIQINTGILNLTNSSFILAATFSNQQEGGTIKINADSIYLNDNSVVSTSSFSSALAGDIFLNANHISISNDSAISSSAYNIGTAGSITIKTQDLDLSYNSKIVTSGLLSNDAGSISISADKINLSSSSISSSIFSDFTEIGVNIVIVNPSLYTSSTISSNSGTGGNISIETQQLLLKNSTISTSSQGSGTGGSIDISAQAIVVDSSSSITASSENSFGGNIDITADGAIFAKGVTIDASSKLGPQFSGTVKIEATESNPNLFTSYDNDFSIHRALLDCANRASSLSHPGSGDTPPNLSDHISMADFYRSEPIQTTLKYIDPETGKQKELIEPVGWAYNSDGTIRFVANKANAVQYASQYTHCQHSASEYGQTTSP